MTKVFLAKILGAPKIYTEIGEASYDLLAEQVIQLLRDHFSEVVVSQMCGVAADGPYQASAFSKHLRKELNIEEDNDLALPVTLGCWSNIFNHVLSLGKGFAFLDSSARRPLSYATQRFASSSHEQWVKIESSYEAYVKAFDLLHPNRTPDEEWQYMITGSDYVEGLLAILDIMEPVVQLMEKSQSLDTPIWKLKLWWPVVKSSKQLPEVLQRHILDCRRQNKI
eukprot:gene1886-2139_t